MGVFSPGEVTEVLAKASSGNEAAVEELLPLVYDDLRAIAAELFRHERAGDTLQPTALVHEAYIRLVGGEGANWESSRHFFAVAAKAMRLLLADRARGRSALKRGGGAHRVTLSGLKTPPTTSTVDLIALDEALTKLGEIAPRRYRIVELRFLAGLSVADTAGVLGLSESTVTRDWRLARAWLRRELGEANHS